jgi:urea transport system permease protein
MVGGFNLELIVSQLLNGLSNTATLFLVAIGLVIIFGMLDVVNMAHGEFIMLGAYFNCTLINQFHLPFAIAIILSFLFVAIIGAVIERVMIQRLYGKIAETLLVTFALTYVFQQIIRMVYGPEDQHIKMPISGSWTYQKITVPYYNIFLMVMAIIVLLITLYLLYKTSYGMQLRATTQNRQMVQCLGINTNKIDCMTFAYGSGLAGLAGALIAPVASVTPGMGTSYVVDSFLVVVLGGLNSIVGTFFGAGIISESVALMASYMSEITAKILIFIIIIVIIRFKPTGLFTTKDRR